MLKRFYVDNFKTHINTTYDAGPVNLLVGMNNSGKTNLCQAMRFVGATSVQSLSQAAILAASEEWSLTNVYLKKSTIDFRVEAELDYEGSVFSFVYELTVKVLPTAAVKDAGSRLAVQREVLVVSGGGFNNTVLIQNEAGQARLLHETRKSLGGAEQYVATNAPVDATMLSRLYDLKDNPRANLFKKYMSSWIYYDLDTLQLRKAEAKILETVLAVDGSNLASVLFNLKNGNERLYRKLIDITRNAIDSRLELLSFFSPAENQVFMFGEDAAGNRFGPWSMSNGTLRFLALGYLFLTPNNYLGIGGSRLVIIEEPETGIYAGHLKELFGLIDRSGANGQFMFTTHAPYFIDLFDDLLEGITITRPGEKNTQLVRPDANKLRTQLESMPLGELHFREMLG